MTAANPNSTCDPKLVDLRQVGFSYLWRKISPYESQDTLYEVLKIILDRLQNGYDPGVILPETLRSICRLLEHEKHPSHIKAAVCAVLQSLCSNGTNTRAFARPELLTILHNILKEFAESGVTLQDLDLILLEQVTGALQVMTYHPNICHSHLINLGLVHHLCTLIIPSCRTTYRHGTASHDLFHKLTAEKFPGLVGNARPLDSAFLQKLYDENYGKNCQSLCLPKQGWSVCLYDTSGAKDVEIHQEMLKQKVVWSPMPEVLQSSLTADSSRPNDSHWFDMYVTSIRDGGHFWALLGGSESFRVVAQVKELIEQFPDKPLLLEPPPGGTEVAGYNDLIGYFRGRVVKVDGGVLHLFAMDYGCILEMAWQERNLFLVTEEMGLHQYAPQAFFCQLQGVSPVPLSVRVLQNVHGILSNLCGSPDHLEECHGQTQMIDTLHYLCQCPEPSLVKLAAEGLANLARSDLFRLKLLNFKTMDMLIDVCENCLFVLHNDDMARAVQALLAAVNNLLFKCPENQELFSQRCGPKVMAMIIKGPVLPHVQQMAKRVLHTFIGAADPIDIVLKEKSGQRIPVRNSDILIQLRLGMSALGIERGVDRRGRHRGRSQGQNKAGAARHKLKSEHSKSPPKSHSQTYRSSKNNSQERKEARLRLEQLEESDSEPEELYKLLERKAGATSGDEARMNGEDVSPKVKGMSPGGEVRLVSASVIYDQLRSQNAYVRGLKVNFKNDATHDFRPGSDIDKISSSMIKKSICGMVNSGKAGSIYMGVQPNQVVSGIKITRHQRDEFRMGVDHQMRRFHPVLPHGLLNVHHHQVVQVGQDSQAYEAIPDLCVIEIRLQSTKGTVYTIENKEIYLRDGGQTDLIMIQDLHRHVVEEEEQHQLREVESLQAELNRLLGKSADSNLIIGS